MYFLINSKLFILSYIGVATSIGQIIHVPIIVRSLANSMALLHESQLPISFDSDFLLMLDIDMSDKDNKC